MPVDTRDKRASCLGTRRGRVSYPLADGSISAGDRQHTAYGYRGIAATAPSLVALPIGAAITIADETAIAVSIVDETTATAIVE